MNMIKNLKKNLTNKYRYSTYIQLDLKDYA